MKSHKEDTGRLINIVSHQLKRKITLSSDDRCGLTNMQNRVLHFILLRTLEVPVYQKDIEKEFDIRKSTATEILKLMEKNGFIYRECSKEDARMKEIIPTEKALTMQKEVVRNIQRVEEKLKEGIPPCEYQVCIDVLKKMIENLMDE
ncbi:MarR family winged helix-turn-helix transcriptional regulator [Blautia sp. Marseille-P3201T]|uniref:MarR family winged helix-turn-helix transcriptional regulator n=1 Tax=Blautia sp. Marseille-P3201T TaxID=1907659 RepID=UPI0009304A5C|nr:MarR family winged helix-turn-helix transcriptional regulator [Blautia sp. Marseille-P3201T]